ncbi:MAG: hypothetical protein QOD99_2474 [Chthoniobacter sp.]|nr:hypothetical protein [Chthoniobacter sp.]
MTESRSSIAADVLPPLEDSLRTGMTEALRKGKILIVDDEEINVRLLERIIIRSDFVKFASTTDPREVESLFQPFAPDIVLLDLHMPHIDGFALMHQLREMIGSDDFLPIVVLTADATLATKRRALHEGATDFLTKPFDQLEVVLRIRNLLESRFSHLKIQEQNATLEDNVRQRTIELERALSDLKAAQHQVIQQERLAALGTMAGGIAHDFNNSLSVIIGFSEILLRDAKNGLSQNAARQPLETILTAAEDASRIVHRLREFYRTGEIEEARLALNLNPLVEQALLLTKPRWLTHSRANGYTIELTPLLGDINDVMGDAAELREVMTNLIFNAVDAMPNGGTITVRTENEGDQVAFRIIDTGMGMTEEVRQRCLEPFFTTKGDRGTGLGLAMVFGIIQRHGGTVEIESIPGKGTAFTIRLPMHANTDVETDAAPETLSRPLHVLVVDDQPVLCQLLCEYLQNDCHTVEAAENGEKALEKFASGSFDIVITDQVMPDMNGVQLASALRESRPDQIIMLLTGYGAPLGSDAETPCVDLVVGKPISLASLRSALLRAMSLGRRRT